MKKISVLLSALLLLCLLPLLSSCGSGDKVKKLYIYNWGEYIDESLLDLFEIYYYETYGEQIEIAYSTYASNEVLYSKLSGGSADIDLIIPSDYMVDRLRQEGFLETLDYGNIPNASGVSIPGLTSDDLVYDPGGLYSVPYTYGTVGLIYNASKVDPADVAGDVSWRILWDEKYTNNILMFNNSRDAFAIAQYILSYESAQNGDAKDYINSKNEADWREALAMLKTQKPIIQAYVMDEVFNTMEGGTAALAPYYAGDYLVMRDAVEQAKLENPSIDFELGFLYPKEGTNLFVDAMCIPVTAKHKTEAERFINFLISTDVTVGGEHYNPALINANYICYACPVTDVRENDSVDENGDYIYECYKDTDAGEILYGDLPDTYTFTYLGADAQVMVSDLWDELKIDTELPLWLWGSSLLCVAALVGLLVYGFVKKRRRAKYY